MKKIYRISLLIAALFLALSLNAFSAGAAEKTVLKKTGGKYYCLVNGKKVKNTWKTIKKKTYYFGADGAAKTGWYTTKKKTDPYRTYFFNTKGVLQTRKTKSADQALFSKMDDVLKNRKVKAVTSSSSAKKALSKLFKYMSSSSFGYMRDMSAAKNKGWEVLYAKEMLTGMKGSCYHFAAAFGFLARYATGYPVRVCIGKSNAFFPATWQPHAWTEIKIGKTWYICDANAARFSSRKDVKWYLQKRSDLVGKVYKDITASLDLEF